MTAVPTPAGAVQASPPFPEGTVGVVGCSNTAQHVRGYRQVSALDQMPHYPMGGLSFEVWGDPAADSHDLAWGRYDGSRPDAGYAAAWVMVCLSAGDDHDPAELLEEVVAQIHDRDPGIPVYVSPINEYAAGRVCSVVGPDAFAIGSATVSRGVDDLGIVPGPVTGPLKGVHLGLDGCHLSPSGIDLVGDQLVDWFDAGGWDLTCAGLAVTMVGSSGANVLEGTSRRDVIHAKGGADRIVGRGGADVICAGSGDDDVEGNTGGDRIYTAEGADVVEGRGGVDIVIGGAGRDIIRGEDGGDLVEGSAGADRLYGGLGDDELVGQAGWDRLIGGAGADTVDGGAGEDTCSGEIVTAC